ncbi:hypothetical protein [Nonomuraea sp. GTA35]
MTVNLGKRFPVVNEAPGDPLGAVGIVAGQGMTTRIDHGETFMSDPDCRI